MLWKIGRGVLDYSGLPKFLPILLNADLIAEGTKIARVGAIQSVKI